MKKELLEFISLNNLSPFGESEAQKLQEEKIFKTKDAKSVYTKVLTKINSHFIFSATQSLFNFFPMTSSLDLIKKRQRFFKEIKLTDLIDCLQKLTAPKPYWKPKYGLVVVTENEKTLIKLKSLGCPVIFLVTQSDLSQLEEYDLVQAIDCDDFSLALERLPQIVFLDSIDEAYVERHLRLLSGWKENLLILSETNNEELKSLSVDLLSLSYLLENKVFSNITKEQAESVLDKINLAVSNYLKNMTLSGDALVAMLSNKTLPIELKATIKKEIDSSGLPAEIFIPEMPVRIDESALEKLMKKQQAKEHTSLAEEIKKNAEKISQIPEKIKKISELIVFYDFLSGIRKFSLSVNSNIFPEHSESLSILNSQNLFLDKAQPISFSLDSKNRCSILTGANSGGKTTLLEHIIQIIVLFQLGLPVSGSVSLPLFSEIYYFAKNKGSNNKGAFETLLTQMSKIKPGKQTLILADEIESVTEPGVAGRIISATAKYFIDKGCFLIIATHLGQQIQKNLPEYARIDGIEAKGLDEYFELIVDHNPVLGRLANSTPELIVEKMANSNKEEYFEYIRNYLKGN